MGFVDELIDSILKDFNSGMKSFLDGICKENKYNFCIGSGSTFNVYKNITWNQAKKIYSNMSVFYCVGSRVQKREAFNVLFEEYHCMESNSGFVKCFIFDVDNIIDDYKEV